MAPTSPRLRRPSFLLAFALACAAPRAADLQPRSYAWLLSHSTLVAAGTVENVSGGLFGDGRSASVRIEGLIKGRWNQQNIKMTWNDKEFEETAYKSGARVVVFAVLKKDSSFAETSPGIACWPVENVDFKGKSLRAIEYTYPMDLLTGVPSSALRTTEAVEKSMNFQMAKRKQWIVADALLPPIKPFTVPKPKPPKAAPKRVVKSRPNAQKSKKLALAK